MLFRSLADGSALLGCGHRRPEQKQSQESRSGEFQIHVALDGTDQAQTHSSIGSKVMDRLKGPGGHPRPKVKPQRKIRRGTNPLPLTAAASEAATWFSSSGPDRKVVPFPFPLLPEEVFHRFLEYHRLIHKAHVAAFRQDDQL